MAATDPKITALRKLLAQHKIDAFVVPSADEFQGEYVPAAARRLEFLTGFTGSNGLAVIHRTKAAFFTDGRYTLQAQTQVPAVYGKHNLADMPAARWVKEKLPPKTMVGFDPKLFTLRQLEQWEKLGLKLKPVPNLIDAIWKDRPAYPADAAFDYPQKFAGESRAAKIKRVCAKLQADALLVAAPDSLCWLLNIRGNDIPHTPFLNAVALLAKNGEVTLFTDPAKIPEKLRGKMKIAPPAQPLSIKLKGKRILCDSAQASVWWAERLKKAGAEIVSGIDPIQLMKARKNDTEIKGIRSAHVRDGAALSSFLCWLDRAWQGGRLTEVNAAEVLATFRAKQMHFRDLSFGTIAGMGSNGAIVHYHAMPETAKKLTHGIFLLDSGGQYWDGTTDVTRTIALGAPTKQQQADFTRVLKGHIALARARFPKGVTGSELDALARMPLWLEGKDYDHGTGHGVGCYLSVHEGPQRISRVMNNVPLESGMVVSNEPGYYKTGAYGIRIENLVLVKEDRRKGDERPFFGFETLTLAPIDRHLVAKALLTKEERDWLDDYHARVLKTLTPLVDKTTGAWLKKMCTKI